MKLLLEYQADVNRQDENGRTVLHRATREGNKAILKLLMEYKADIDVTTDEKKTAL